MKRFVCLLLCTALLAGCGQLSLMPRKPAAESVSQPESRPAGEELRVWLTQADGALQALFDVYASQRGVQVLYTSQQDCDLAVLRTRPGESWAALEGDALDKALLELLAESGGERGVTLGREGYGYLVNTRLLTALLGEGALPAVQRADFDEWEALCKALAAWLEKPSARTVTLDEQDFTLPAEKDELTEGLTALFTVDPERTAEALSYALAAARSPTDPLPPEADNLEAPLAALYEALELEEASLWAPVEGALTRQTGQEAFLTGQTLFCRTDTLQGGVLAGRGMSLALVGLKLELDGEEIASGLDPQAFHSRPVAGAYRYLALQPEGDTDAAKAFLYWMNVSQQGQKLLTDSMGLVQPGLPSPLGEPGRGLAEALEAGETLPAFSDRWDGDELAAAAALMRAAGEDGSSRKAFVQDGIALLCPEEAPGA